MVSIPSRLLIGNQHVLRLEHMFLARALRVCGDDDGGDGEKSRTFLPRHARATKLSIRSLRSSLTLFSPHLVVGARRHRAAASPQRADDSPILFSTQAR